MKILSDMVLTIFLTLCGKEREHLALKSNGSLRYIKDPNLEKYENTFHFLYSNDPLKDSDGILQVRKEKHLLLSIRSLILQPGEKHILLLTK